MKRRNTTYKDVLMPITVPIGAYCSNGNPNETCRFLEGRRSCSPLCDLGHYPLKYDNEMKVKKHDSCEKLPIAKEQ